jgi:hypothetical protein
MQQQQYDTMLAQVGLELQAVGVNNGGSIFPVDPQNNQFALFRSAKYPGVYALVFGWNRGGSYWGGQVQIALLVDKDFKPVKPDLIQKIEPVEKPLPVRLFEEYQGLMAQFWPALQAWNFSEMSRIHSEILVLQGRAAAAGLNPNDYPLPQFGAGGK